MNRPYYTIELRLVKHDESGPHPFCPEQVGAAFHAEEAARARYNAIKAQLAPADPGPPPEGLEIYEADDLIDRMRKRGYEL